MGMDIFWTVATGLIFALGIGGFMLSVRMFIFGIPQWVADIIMHDIIMHDINSQERANGTQGNGTQGRDHLHRHSA